MEYRLFFIGLAMGAFAWFSRGWQKEGGPDTPLKSALWHALFFFISGFSVTMILAMSFETRARFISVAAHVIPVGELYPSLAIGALRKFPGVSWSSESIVPCPCPANASLAKPIRR